MTLIFVSFTARTLQSSPVILSSECPYITPGTKAASEWRSYNLVGEAYPRLAFTAALFMSPSPSPPAPVTLIYPISADKLLR